MTTLTLPRTSFIDRYAPPIYLLLITIGEVLTTYAPPTFGMVIHALLLLGLLAHTAASDAVGLRALLLALCIAPLIRILSLALPLSRLPQISWYALVSVPLFLACWLLVRDLGYGRRQLGLRVGNLVQQLLIALIGVVLGVAEYFILRPQPLISALTWQQLLLPALILLVCTGFSEELIFRGVMQHAASEAIGKWAVIYVAAIFAVLHIGYRSVVDVLFVFAVGLLFGWIVNHTQSLLGVTLAHGITNILLFLVMPFFGLPQIAVSLPAMPTLPEIAVPNLVVPDWVLEVGLLGLWAGLLAIMGLLTRFNAQRQQRRTTSQTNASYRQQVNTLLQANRHDPQALAQVMRQWLNPDYVLVVGRDDQQSVITVAIGASGRRLQGMEGLRASWPSFEPLAAAAQSGILREVTYHPFSRHIGNYLITPLSDEQWLLLRVSQHREESNQSALRLLGV
jgi:uncharacterized protein